MKDKKIMRKELETKDIPAAIIEAIVEEEEEDRSEDEDDDVVPVNLMKRKISLKQLMKLKKNCRIK